MLVAIEGIDGAGKNTVGSQLKSILIRRGLSVEIVQFPQYGMTYGGRALGDFLAGRHPIPRDIKVVSALYAIDRLEYLDSLKNHIARNDVIIFDRYVGSNLAFQAAKEEEDKISDLLRWIVKLEIEVFGLPTPDINVLLKTSLAQARRNVLEKTARSYTEEAFDVHERDDSLQARAQYMYEFIASKELFGKWLTIETNMHDGSRRNPFEMATEISNYIKI